LYGGAAGGGKSDALVAEALRQVGVPNYRGILFRDTVPQLEGLISRSWDLYPKAFPKAKFNKTEKVWRFPTGAKIFFGHMQYEDDKRNYQGLPYDFIGMDELTHFTQSQYEFMISRNRPIGPGTICYMRSTANPDGPGMGWVKNMFVTPAKPRTTIWANSTVVMPDGTLKNVRRSRIYIPATVFDNKILLENNPNYLASLAILPEADRNALLYGSWDSFQGQVFREWMNDPEHYEDRRWTHVVKPFDIPSSWKIVRGFDFGYARPFSVGWYAIDHFGKVYRIAAWYGCNGTPNKGIQLHPHEIAKGIREKEESDPILKGRKITGIADPSIWDESRGESIARQMENSPNYIYWSPGDNTRLAGKMQCHYYLAFDRDGDTMFQVFDKEENRDFIRTIPMLVYSEKHPEDIDTDLEDHIYDEWRYVLMDRPIAPRENMLQRTPLDDPLNLFADRNKGKKYNYVNV
jgi:hypothetical protein